MERSSLLPLLLIVLLIPQIVLTSSQTPREIIEQAVEGPLRAVTRVPEYNSPSEIPQGSYGYVNGVLYVDKSGFTFGAIPDLEFNIYASLILAEALQASNFMDFDEGEVSRAKTRLASMTTWMLERAKNNGLWGSDVSGRLVDVSFSAQAIRAVAGAFAAGALPREKLPSLAHSVSQLISLQSEGGGWGRMPEADVFQLKEPSPSITAQALRAILAAKEAGVRVAGLDNSVRKAISFLVATSKKSKDFNYWQEEKSSSVQVTGDVADALAEAMFLGFDVDYGLVKGVVAYLESNVKQAYSSGTYEITTALALNALAKFSSLGYLETDKFVASYEPLLVDLASTIRSDGLFTNLPFVWLRYAYTYTYVSIFAYWLRVSSISAQAYFIGGYGDYNPPVVVEGTEITLKVKVENKISNPLSLLMNLDVGSPAALSSKPQSKITLSGGKSKDFSIKIAAPDQVPSPVNVTVKLFIKEANSGKPLFTKSLIFRILRNPRLSLESKTVKPTTVQLRKPVNVTLVMSNTGDLPIVDISMIEKLGAGFELVTSFPGNGTALVTSTNSLGSYVIPNPLEPGARLALIYQAIPTDAPPGPQILSTTLITYTDARGEVHNISKEVKVTILRPYVILSSNTTNLQLEWDEEEGLVVALSNTGNEDATEVELKIATGEGITLNLSMVPEDVLLRPNPDGSMLLRIDKLKSGDTMTIPLRLKATNFYPATELGSFISVGYEYKDSIGRSMPQFSDSTIIKVRVRVSKNFIYLISVIILVIAVLMAIRLYNRVRRSKESMRRVSPLVARTTRRRGRGRRSPFGS
ncbi:MAG: hypothetical protein QI197_07525 [Candidatus Korarchaeota archaeon]|nr:hypothetical protein [Candidatus Korarchaeota archaeon]